MEPARSVTVQTGVAARGDLTAIVTASGEIKPKNYINLGANAQGRIMELLVKEGDHVRKGQVVARIEQHPGPGRRRRAEAPPSLPPQADSTAAEAGLEPQDDIITTAAGHARSQQVRSGAARKSTSIATSSSIKAD